MIVKKFRGRTFYGCSKYPDCKYTSSKNPVENTENSASEDSQEE